VKKESAELSRRAFAKAAALTTAAALVPVNLVAEQQTPSAAPKESPAPPASRLSPESQAEADLAYETLMRKYESRFTDEQKAEIRRLVVQQQSSLDKLRATTVQNSDEPATVFQIYRGEGK